MVETSKGITNKPASTSKLVEYFKARQDLDGHLYIGYPIFFVGGEKSTVDALWVSQRFGVVVFDVIEGTELDDRTDNFQDELYMKFSAFFSQHGTLNIKRQLAVAIEVITYAPYSAVNVNKETEIANNNNELTDILKKLRQWQHSTLYESVVSVIQSVYKLKPPIKRKNVEKNDSKGAILKRLETTIANLDQEQEKAVIEAYQGIQRIRGLAGSGKTVVLALKAAYFHAQNPDWKIAITFNTRSLKGQFTELIERFCLTKTGEVPDWQRLRIIHAWGSPNSTGIYYELCKECGAEYMDFKSAVAFQNSTQSNDKSVFDVVCTNLLSETNDFNETYDAIFVDEAQDLSESFLKICFKILKEPKRLIYAYDELQRLNEGSTLSNPNKIFDRDANDTILYKCYRNSRPLLVTAHALGFGAYRREGLVQFFDQPQLWRDVGYTIKEGKLEADNMVSLCRTSESSPEHLENHSMIDDILTFKTFDNPQQQAEWIVEQIKKNIEEDELFYQDIIVINPDPLTTKKEAGMIRSLLFSNGINSHIAGEFNADIFFRENSITFTGINRAKGNEVAMVYIINADYCYGGGGNLIKKRNILFTAITRSKAWVRVCGLGDRMNMLIDEYNEVKNNDFELKFRYPTAKEIEKMNLIHRDLSETEKQKINQDINSFNDMLKIIRKINSGENYVEDYPKEMQVVLLELLEHEKKNIESNKKNYH
ncbi:MAG: ATP-binding domain-containing protein [Candidatus Magnetobacterium sp. LHC-1]|nr:ATP-binding domain-containing protein [Nitrospirota bacterium]